MDLKIALSGELPARCSDALAALAPELGMVPAAEGVPVAGTGAQLLPFAATEHSVTIRVGAAHPVLPCAQPAAPSAGSLRYPGRAPALRRSA